MSLDTLTKRAYAQLDSGLPGYPDGSLDIEDRAKASNIWYFYEVLVGQKSYLGKINEALLDGLETLGDTQQEDLAKATFPLYNLYLIPNVSVLSESTHIDINSYRYDAFWEIHCYDKTTDHSDSRFAHNRVLFGLLDNIKTLLGTNIGMDLCERVEYNGCEIVKLGEGADILIPQKLVVRLRTSYSQRRDKPQLEACDVN